MKLLTLAATLALALGARPSAAQSVPEPGQADLVELTIAAPIIVRAEVDRTSRIDRELSPGLAEGYRRLLVHADVANLLIAPSAIPRRIEYLVDVPTDSRGREPDLDGREVLLFLNPSPRDPEQFQLVKPWAQVPWTAARDAYVRKIARAKLDPKLRDVRITGLGQAFHVPGTLPGEGESQIFVETASGRPVSLVVLSRPGQEKKLSVATGDIIDEAAAGVEPGSILWYELACNLPATLPDDSISTLEPDNARAVTEDYRFVRESIGKCDKVFGLEE
jgi:hypothetical protein